MNTEITVNVQGEIRFPDIALLAQAMMRNTQPAAPAPAAMPPQPAADPVAVAPTVAPQTAPVAPAGQMPPKPAITSAHAAAPVVPVTEAPKYSIDDIARAGAELAQQGPDKIAALTGLLQQFGLQAVTQLRPEQMGPFVLALRGMGARI